MRATSNRKLAGALGVSETAVRKALASGRISREPDGGFDVARVQRQWAGNTDAAQQRPARKADPNLRPVPAAALASGRVGLRQIRTWPSTAESRSAAAMQVQAPITPSSRLATRGSSR
jgi:hypothetical protein